MRGGGWRGLRAASGEGGRELTLHNPRFERRQEPQRRTKPESRLPTGPQPAPAGLPTLGSSTALAQAGTRRRGETLLRRGAEISSRRQSDVYARTLADDRVRDVAWSHDGARILSQQLAVHGDGEVFGGR